MGSFFEMLEGFQILSSFHYLLSNISRGGDANAIAGLAITKKNVSCECIQTISAAFSYKLCNSVDVKLHVCLFFFSYLI